MTKRAALALVLAACVAALVARAALSSAPPAREATGDGDLTFAPHPGAVLPLDAPLIDETGRAVALKNVFDRTPVLLIFTYLRCTSLCGVSLESLVASLARLPLEPGRDYLLVSVSIDPRDGPAQASAARAKYAALLGRGGNGVRFLTGPETAVRPIAQAAGFPYRYDRLYDAYIHPAGFIVAAPNGVVSGAIEGLATSPQRLAEALAKAQRKAAPGLIERVALLCHVQGAPLGRYTTPVMAALMLCNVAAGLTLILVFGALRRRR